MSAFPPRRTFTRQAIPSLYFPYQASRRSLAPQVREITAMRLILTAALSALTLTGCHASDPVRTAGVSGEPLICRNENFGEAQHLRRPSACLSAAEWAVIDKRLSEQYKDQQYPQAIPPQLR